MASDRAIMVMAFLVVIFLFGGLMVSFIIQSEGFLEKQSGRVTIHDEAVLSQLATHVALRAYNCDDQKGGQWTALNGKKYWGSWKSYVDYAKNTGNTRAPDNGGLSFEAIRSAMPYGNLQCSGTPTTLPLTDKSLLQSAGGSLANSHWGNDQEGRFGRVKFRFNETMWVGGEVPGVNEFRHGCWGFETSSGHGKGLTDMMILLTDNDDYSFFSWAQEIDQECVSIKDPTQGVDIYWDNGGSPKKGAFMTLTVIGDVKDKRPGLSYTVSEGALLSEGDVDNAQVDGEVMKICKGATGYIQANTGGIPATVDSSTPINVNNPSINYHEGDVPGEHGEQVGGTAGTDNRIRLFMVLENADTC